MIKVLSVSAEPPYAIISLPSYTSRDAFLSLAATHGDGVMPPLLVGKLSAIHIKSNWDCGCRSRRTGEGCGICVEGANHYCWKWESWRPLHRSADCPRSTKK